MWEAPGAKKLRIDRAQKRKIRKLCGWNAFQRSELQGLVLDSRTYKTTLKELSARWKSMTPEEREPYNLEAEFQQVQIDALSQKPLPSALESSTGYADGEAADGVWKHARQKISSRRLALNVDAFKSHELWDLPTQFGDGRPAL